MSPSGVDLLEAQLRGKRRTVVEQPVFLHLAVLEQADLEAVHEWGTFTSVAAPNGQAVDWRPLSGPADLPCFVSQLNQGSFKVLVSANGWLSTVKAKVRMETPVLYFYSPREQTVNVSVSFPQGVITEWYPQAKVPAAKLPLDLPNVKGTIDWTDVQVSPGAKADYPTEAGQSHYYAARETDASPVRVGAQREKFLFYRGLASFPVAVSGKVLRNGKIAIENSGLEEISSLILLESRGGRLGYRVQSGVRGRLTLDRPALTGDFQSLRLDLESILVGQGLYPREARAMIETWRDSWFEEGTRLFYIVPRAAVDSILPLEITPKPAEVARVFVGRLELITPAMQNDVEQAILANDLDALNSYGRFLEPIAQSIMVRPSLINNQAAVQAQLQAVAKSHAPRVCK